MAVTALPPRPPVPAPPAPPEAARTGAGPRGQEAGKERKGGVVIEVIRGDKRSVETFTSPEE
jgi:hypothetical protein